MTEPVRLIWHQILPCHMTWMKDLSSWWSSASRVCFAGSAGSLNSLPVGHSHGGFADLLSQPRGSTQSVYSALGGGSPHDGKSAQEKAEQGGDAEVNMDIRSPRLINCLQSQFSPLWLEISLIYSLVVGVFWTNHGAKVDHRQRLNQAFLT